MFRSLRARFVGLLFLGFTLFVLAIAVLFFQYRTQIAHTERLGQAAAVASTLDQLFANVLQASNTSRRYVLSGDVSQLTAYQQAVSEIPDIVEEIQSLTQDQSAFVTGFDYLGTRLAHKLDHLDEILSVYANGEVATMRGLLVGGDGLERLEALRDAVSAFRSVGFALADEQREQFRISVLVQVAVVFLMLLCGIAWAALLGNEALRNILQPISSMSAQVKRIAAGDFRDTLPVARRDEIGRLAEHINHMTAQLSIARDEREEAQAELAKERQNLIDALEALDEGFAAYDSDGLLMRCNQKFLDYYPALISVAKPGASYEAMLTQKAASASEPIAIGREEDFVAERLAEFALPNTQRECILSDGRILQRSSYRTRQGGHVAVYVDITEIKLAQETLKELNRDLDARVQARTDDLNDANAQLQLVNAELQAIIGSAPVAVVALSPDREVMTWNPAAAMLTGLKKDEVEPGLTNLVAPEARNTLGAFLDGVYGGARQTNAEFQLLNKSGQKIETNVFSSVLSDDKDRPFGAILIIADLTEERALQSQFQQSQKMEVVAKLTAGLAHDFNNLLAIVISNIEMLESRIPETGDARDMLKSAKRASLSGVALNKKLLAFSRGKSMELEELDLVQEIVFLTSLLQITLGEGIALDIELSGDTWPVRADRALLQSALLNLAVNARDAMPNGGGFHITAENQSFERHEPNAKLVGDFVAISIKDTGEGMTEEVMSRVFQPFFTTKDFGKSSGLGLSMVYGFVQQTGGDIHIESKVGAGSIFTIFLPRADAMTSLGAETPDAPLSEHPGNDEVILVVEDNDELRRALVLQIAELGFHPIQAESGATALDLLEAEVPIDLLLTDIVMPGGIDGRELAKKARDLKPDLPVVFLSGYPASGEDGDEVSWETLGIKVLAKPVTQVALGEHIAKSLEATS